MDWTRVGLILAIGIMAYGVRALPQVLCVGPKFPESGERWLRYLSYALICSIVALTLFMTGGRFERAAAPARALALIAAIVVAHRTRSPLAGMLAGTALVAALKELR